MNTPSRDDRSFPMEDFVQALTAQLDRAQDALALKARTGRPLTFALKDLSLDLRVFCESDPGGARSLAACVAERGRREHRAAVIHLDHQVDGRGKHGVDERRRRSARARVARGRRDTAAEEDRDKLERVGVRTVGQLQRLSGGANPNRLRPTSAFRSCACRRRCDRRPSRPSPATKSVRQGPRLLRVRGVNLSDGARS